MEDFDRRTAQRKDLNVVAKVSKNSQEWVDAHVADISCGGLRFQIDRQFTIGDILRFDLYITNVMRDIKLKVKGEVIGELGVKDGMHAYRVEFKEISDEDRINLDELIKYIHNHIDKMVGFK